MTQYALPISDRTITNWSEGAGDADGDTFDELDEGFGAGRGSGSGPDDATTYWVTTNEGVNQATTNLSTVTDPGVDTGHNARFRNRKNTSGGRQLDAQMVLEAGPFSIFEDTTSFPNIDNVWTTRVRPLSTGEAAQIGANYDALIFRTSVIETGGGTPRIGWESAQEFDCPDAGPAVGQPTMQRTQGIPTGPGSRDRPRGWN